MNAKFAPMKNPVILALDVDTREQALKFADDLQDIVGGFKLGPRLCVRYGQSLIKEISERGPVFVDNKYFDIPSTMVAAVRASFEAGASLVTVHALSGKEALKELAVLEQELNQIRPFRILAVSILTSWDQNSLPPNFKVQDLSAHVTDLVTMAKNSGIKGIVCSAHELSLFKNQGLYIVTPGIRFNTEKDTDQKRVMEPKEAMVLGASALVVGRPILRAKNPRVQASEFVAACCS